MQTLSSFLTANGRPTLFYRDGLSGQYQARLGEYQQLIADLGLDIGIYPMPEWAELEDDLPPFALCFQSGQPVTGDHIDRHLCRLVTSKLRQQAAEGQMMLVTLAMSISGKGFSIPMAPQDMYIPVHPS